MNNDDDDRLEKLKHALKTWPDDTDTTDHSICSQTFPTFPTVSTTLFPTLTTAQISSLNLNSINMGALTTPSSIIPPSGSYTFSSLSSTPTMKVSNDENSGVIELTGKKADIKINGRSLVDALDDINRRLGILKPNQDLEAEWDELLELGNRYRELEQRIKDKEKTFSILKSNTNSGKLQ